MEIVRFVDVVEFVPNLSYFVIASTPDLEKPLLEWASFCAKISRMECIAEDAPSSGLKTTPQLRMTCSCGPLVPAVVLWFCRLSLRTLMKYSVFTSSCHLTALAPNSVDAVIYVAWCNSLVPQIQDDPHRGELSLWTVPMMNMSGKILFFLFLFPGARPKSFFAHASFRDLDIVPRLYCGLGKHHLL